VGGHDRGLDWHDFVQHMAHDVPPVEIITLGANGPRIHALLQPLADAGRFGLHAAADLPEALQLARTALGEQGGVVLMSPGAPSYGVYRDYVARGRHFAALAGFEPDAITAIAGIGIA
jgi:UDP-N-acetylmuramoylalanine--D-glutamate ligase